MHMTNTVRLGVLTGLAIAVGCADQRSAFVRPAPNSMIKINQADVAAAKDAPEPAITADTHYQAGLFHESIRQFTDAIEQYRKCTILDPKYVPAHDRLGVVSGFLGRHDDAIKAFNAALALRPGDAAIRNNLGFEYILVEDWPQAEREFRRALMTNPNFRRARINLAVTLGAQKQFDEALTQYKKVLNSADAYYNLGLAYRMHRQYAHAKKTFKRVLSINPKFTAAQKQLANLPAARKKANKTPLDATEAKLFAQPWQYEEPKLDTTPIIDQTTLDYIETTANRDKADIDSDGDVDLADFALLQACLAKSDELTTPECMPADLNGDGTVNLDDYQIFQKKLKKDE
jgi:tetratricopeptide (TPR) repeat protein